MTFNTADTDRCDRCGAEDGRRIHVGHQSRTGFDGLCDECLDALAAPVVGGSTTSPAVPT